MFNRLSAAAAFLAAGTMVRGQGVGTEQTETHPTMTWSKCTSGGSCTSQSGQVVIDSNWRWTHFTGGYVNCYTGNTWNSSACTSNAACAQQCVLEGADYQSTYGASTSGNALSLQFVTKGTYSTNIGSRLYLMASNTAYQMFTLLGNEFTFDVDVSQLPCGLNGALYFVSMDSDGGMAKYSTNKAGAQYGTGYCDSQCPRDLKFIDGACNCEGWQPSSNDPNAGIGNVGSCCSEMDIWEANSMNSAVTPHPCETVGQHACQASACGGTYSGASNRYNSDCDPDGCDYNPYRMGVTNFYGSGMTVDTSQKFTVVTQFIESGGSLSEINQFFVQGGKTIPMPNSTWPTLTGYNSITEAFCEAQKAEFGDTDNFDSKGGLAQMGKAVAGEMVLVMSLWDDHYADMLWLDSLYPTTASASSPGKLRGSCSTSSGVPAQVESQSGSATVIYSNIRFGPVGSTTSST